MLQRVGRGRQSGLRQAGRDHAGLRGAADLKALGEGSEIGDEAARHRARDRERGRGFISIETAQLGAGGGGRDGAAHRGRVPAFLVQRHGLAH